MKQLLFCLPLLSATGAMAADGMPALDGRWESLACELRPQQGEDGVSPWYLTRSIVFDGNRIAAHFTTFADATCSTPLGELKFGGGYAASVERTLSRFGC